jgi:hypothetical protein
MSYSDDRELLPNPEQYHNRAAVNFAQSTPVVQN